MESLAVKYRPQVFEDLIGQDAITKTLINSLKTKKIHHSYLFYGPRGCGKTSTARILSKALNCHSPENYNPCNKCISCKEITSSSSVDVIEIDAASHTQVQNIRDVIIDNVNLSPARDKYRIYILDEVHMLSTSAFNALLKTIEEPPEHAVFIMATTEINKVPLTIISRCLTFKFKPLSAKLMIKRLKEICEKENINYEEKALELIVNFSGGAVRDSLSLLEKVASFSQNNVNFKNVSEIIGYPSDEIIEKLSKAILERDIKAIHSIFESILEEGIDTISVLKEVRDYYSKCFLAKNGVIKMETPDDYNPFLFAKLSRKIHKIIDEIKFSDNIPLLAETFIYTIIDTTVDFETIIKKLENVKTETEQKDSNIEKAKEEKTENQKGWTSIWKKILEFVSKESIATYNILLSSDIRLENEILFIYVKNSLEYNMILNQKEFIQKTLNKITSSNYKVIVEIKKKVDNTPISTQSITENENLDGYKLIDIAENNEIIFPEIHKIKKVFGNDIVRITKEK